MSTAGDALLGLTRTCSKFKVAFLPYLEDCLHTLGAIAIPPLPKLVH